MNASNAANARAHGAAGSASRGRLVRDRSVVERLGLRAAEPYRVAYVIGGVESRRVSRSLAVFEGISERRRWDGRSALCLDFVLPHGRPLSLLPSQVVDVRPTGLNERGQWVLLAQDREPRSHRPGRRSGER